MKWCFIECAHGETKRETVLFHDVSYGRTHSTNSQPFENWDVEEKGMEKGKGRLAKE